MYTHQGGIMEKRTTSVSFRCPGGLLARIEYRAEQEHRTKTQVILSALREYLHVHRDVSTLIRPEGRMRPVILMDEGGLFWFQPSSDPKAGCDS